MALTREPIRVTIKMINVPRHIDHTNQTITLSVITLTGFHCFTYYYLCSIHSLVILVIQIVNEVLKQNFFEKTGVSVGARTTGNSITF